MDGQTVYIHPCIAYDTQKDSLFCLKKPHTCQKCLLFYSRNHKIIKVHYFIKRSSILLKRSTICTKEPPDWSPVVTGLTAKFTLGSINSMCPPLPTHTNTGICACTWTRTHTHTHTRTHTHTHTHRHTQSQLVTIQCLPHGDTLTNYTLMHDTC